MNKKLIKSNVIHISLSNKANDIFSEINLSTPTDFEGENAIKCSGIWDTGSHGCVISSKLIESLKPPFIGFKLISGVLKKGWSPEYLLNIHLSDDFIIKGVGACEGSNLDDNEFLIGMEVINMGDFAITNVNQKTAFSYRIPSIRRINFQIEKTNAINEESETNRKQNKATRRTRKSRKRKRR